MSSLSIIQSSCADLAVDAVVNAANRHLMAGSGICGVIFARAGMRELTDECSKHHTPLYDGQAVITSSCRMTNCSHIIHAVGPDFNNTPTAFSELVDAYYNSLRVLRENGLHSISFPLISASIFGGKLENAPATSARSCIEAYNKFIENFPEYDVKVTLCAFTDREVQQIKDGGIDI